MAKKFSNLRQAMSLEAQACAHEKAAAMIVEMSRAELHPASNFSRVRLASELKVHGKRPTGVNTKH